MSGCSGCSITLFLLPGTVVCREVKLQINYQPEAFQIKRQQVLYISINSNGFFMFCVCCTMLTSRSTLPLCTVQEWFESQRKLSLNPRSATYQPCDLASLEEIMRMKGKNTHSTSVHITDYCSTQRPYVCLHLPSVCYIFMHSCNKYAPCSHCGPGAVIAAANALVSKHGLRACPQE